MSVEELLAQINGRGYRRVSVEHIVDLYIGRDEHLRPTLRLTGDFELKEMASTDAIEVVQYAPDARHTYSELLFSMRNEDMATVFYPLWDQLIELTVECGNAEECYNYLRDRFMLWIKGLGIKNDKILERKDIMGLIGELLHLRDYMIPNYNLPIALESWTGPDMTHKDFTTQDSWYELKTVEAGKNTVKISSMEQLDSSIPGRLVIYKLEQVAPPANGITLNALVEEINAMLTRLEWKIQFEDKLQKLHYVSRPEYDNFVFTLSDCLTYDVNDDFPRLRKQAIPEAIVKASYELDIPMLQQFKID